MKSLFDIKPTHLIPRDEPLHCGKCQRPVSDARLNAIKLELELMGVSDRLCTTCWNQEVVKVGVM